MIMYIPAASFTRFQTITYQLLHVVYINQALINYTDIIVGDLILLSALLNPLTCNSVTHYKLLLRTEFRLEFL